MVATTLRAGEIAFTAYQSDTTGGLGSKGFQFVLLRSVKAGTAIYFTDGGYRTNSSAFDTDETLLRWIAPTDMPAGSKVSFSGSPVSGSTWSGINPVTGAVLPNASIDLNTAGDQITALINPAFGGANLLTGTAIAQINFSAGGFLGAHTSGNDTDTALAPGLLAGDPANSTAVNFGDVDDGIYNGAAAGAVNTGVIRTIANSINGAARWQTANDPIGSNVTAATFTVAEPNLAVGDIAVGGYNTGNNLAGATTVDSLQIVALKPITAGTVIFITDRAWNGTAFAAAGGGDGTITHTFASNVAAGSIVTIPLSGGVDLEQAGDALYIYQGNSADIPTSFLFALELGDGNSTFNGSLLNTGLSNGAGALSVGYDSAVYNGPTTEAYAHLHNQESLFLNMSDSTNWNGDDHGGQNALDQTDHSGPYHLASDANLWLAALAGGDGIVSFGVDPSAGGGATGHNLTIRYTLDNGDLVDTLVAPRDISFDTVEGKFFILDSNSSGGTNRILQGNISDLHGNPQAPLPVTVLYTSNQVASSGEAQMRDIQIDVANNIIYFTHGQRLEKIVYNTTNQNSTVLATFGGNAGVGNPNGNSNNFIDDFVINFATGTAYLTSHRVISGQDGDGVSKNYIYKVSNLTGTATFANGQISVLPFSPDDDDATNNIGWAPGEAFPQEEGTLEGIALSTDGNTLIFSTAKVLYDHDGDGGVAGVGGTPPQLIQGGIFTYALNGNPNGNYTQIFGQTDDGDTNSQAITAAGPQGLLDDVEVDPVTGHIYFLDQTGDQLIIGGVSQNPPGDEGVWRINANGTGLVFVQAIHNINGLGANSIHINRAPTLTGNGLAAAVTEASSALNSGETNKPLLFGSISIADADTGDGTDEIAHAVVRISNFFTGDLLRISNNTNGTTASGITYAYNAATGAMTLTGAATAAEYASALALVTYSHTGDNPTNFGTQPTRTIFASVGDGLNHSDEISVTVNVTGINDTPTSIAGDSVTVSEDSTNTALLGTTGSDPVRIKISDVDADPATQDLLVTFAVGFGTLALDTSVAGGIAAANITAQSAGVVTVLATQNQINTTLAASGLRYTPAANFNGTDTLTITTNDRGLNGNDPGASGTGTTEENVVTKTITVTEVNDAPSVTNGATETLAAILEDVPQTAANAPTVAQVFGGHFSDAIDVQVGQSNPTGSQGDSLAGIAVVANGSTAGTGQWQWYNGSAWDDIGTVSSDAAKTYAAATLIRFNPALNYNGAAPTLTVRLIESSATAVANNATVDLDPAPPIVGPSAIYTAGTVVLSQAITAVNDAPVNTVGATVDTTEDVASVALTGMSVADVEATNPVYYFLVVQNGTLTLRENVAGGVTPGQMVGNGTNAVSGYATIAQINATLAASNGVLYTPTANFNGADTVSVYVNDEGQTGQDPNSATLHPLSVDGAATEEDFDTRTITVAAANDPVTTNAPATLTTDEDSTGVAVTGLSIADIDATLAPNGVYVVTLSSTNGTMTLSTLTGLTFSAGDGTSDATMTFRGTLAAINSALATATYTPAGNHNGSAEIQLQATDQFGADVATGSGAATSDSDTVAVTVEAVNDPIGTIAPGAVSLNEDAVDFAVTGMSITDVDAALAPAGVYEVTLSATQGTLKLTTVTGLTFSTGDGDGDTTMTFSGTLADINTALATAKYTPNANYDGTAQIQLQATDTFGGNVATGSGSATADGNTINVTVNSVNDAPAGSDDNSSDVVENATHIFTAANFATGMTDPNDDPANVFAGVRITTLPATGTIFFDADGAGGAAPVPIAAGDDFTAQEIADGKLTYVAAAGSGDTVQTFTFQVRDDGGTSNGGVDLDQTANTFTFNVDPANLAPAVDLDGANPDIDYDAAYTENDATGVLIGSGVSVTEPDAGDMIEQMTLTITAPLNGDVIAFGASAAGFSVVGSTGAGGEAIVTVSGTGTAAQYQAILSEARFRSSSDNPDNRGANPTRTIEVVVNDGSANSAAAKATVTITSTPDKPTGLNDTLPVAEDGFRNLGTGNFNFQDVDGDAFQSVTISNVTGGKLFIDANGGDHSDAVEAASTVTLGLLDFAGGDKVFFAPTPNSNAQGSLSFTLKDDSGAANGADTSDARTLTFNISAVNDAPVVDLDASASGIDFSTGYTENGAAIPIVSGATIGDVDAGDMIESMTVTLVDPRTGDVVTRGALPAGFGASLSTANGQYAITITGTGTAAQYGMFLSSFRFVSNSEDPTFRGSDPSRTFTVTVSDGEAASATATTTVTITPQADKPIAAGNTVDVVEDGTYGIKVADFGFTDGDGDALASVTISNVTGGQLFYDANGGDHADAVAVAVLPVTYSVADLGTGDRLLFRPSPNSNNPGSLTFTVTDDSAAAGADTSASASLGFIIDEVNDHPQLQLSADGPSRTLDYRENDGAIAIAPGAILTDVDSFDFEDGSLKVSLGATGRSGDELGILELGGITVAGGQVRYNGDVIGTIVSAGGAGGGDVEVALGDAATVEAVDRLIEAISFRNGSENPSTAQRTVTYTVNDGGGGDAIGTAAAVVHLTNANDAPGLTVPTGTQNGTEDVAFIFSAGALNAITISDVDIGAGVASVVLSVPNGTLALGANIAGLAVPPVGNGSDTVTLVGTVSAINDALEGLTYTGPLNGNGARTLTISVSDNGFSGPNLIVNPGAEVGAAATDYASSVVPFGWTLAGGNGTFTALNYNIAGQSADDLDENDSAAVGGGTAYFAGGPSTPASTAIRQLIDVSGDAAKIDAGVMIANLSGVFGGYLSVADSMTMTVNFLSASAAVLGSSSIGGATPGDRGNQTLLIPSVGIVAVPPLTRSIEIVLTAADGGDGAYGNGYADNLSLVLSERVTKTVSIELAPVDDQANAQPDTPTTNENMSAIIDVRANDTDVDSAVAQVTSVGGMAISVGQTVDLPSGARVTLNADGTLTYNPNGKFVTLNDGSGGAVNSSAIDVFSYVLADGSTSTVTMTVTGVAGPGDLLEGDSGDNVITGTPQGDVFILHQGGDDKAYGLASSDLFVFRAAMTSADEVDGGDATDQISLQGDYATVPLTLGTKVVSVEFLLLNPGNDTRRGDPGTNFYSYNITTVTENVAPGVQMRIDAARLRAGEDFTFNGSAETDGGTFRIYGGEGVDNLTGGSGSDVILFGNGAFGASDIVNGGAGAARDQLALRGNYTLTFGSAQIVSIESLLLQSGRDVRDNTDYQYDITMVDANVVGGSITVDAGQLRAAETLKFNGSAEDDATFRIFGGDGNDVLTGGQLADRIHGQAGADDLTGNGGNDSFVYRGPSESTAAAQDRILDFTLGDLIDLATIDARTGGTANDSFTFIGGNAFSNEAGQLRAELTSIPNVYTVQGDIDGNGSADFQLQVTVADLHPLTAADFVL